MLSLSLPFLGTAHEIDGLDDKSEPAHCIMLVNLLRVGAIKTRGASRQIVSCPFHYHPITGTGCLTMTNFIPDLKSPLKVETLFICWSSESWGEYAL
jgi:3-oxoacyl-ACP reductase-like protein